MKKRLTTNVIAVVLPVWGWMAGVAAASDWPAWRYDAARSGASPAGISTNLHLQWVLTLPRQDRAWPNEPRQAFDVAYSPVVAGNRMFFCSTIDDSLTSVDIDSGATSWKFHSQGPMRFAPAVEAGRVYCSSDDGHLYCVDAESGKLLWKFRGAPSDKKGLGNGRLISLWPARGAPALADGKVYFAAGIWPFMGVFIHSLDARTGRVLWSNDTAGDRYMDQPHGGAVSFGALAPQGYFAVLADKLFIPNGRAALAVLERQTGECVHFDFGGTGAYPAPLRDGSAGNGKVIFTGSIKALRTADHAKIWEYPAPGNTVFCAAGDQVYAGRPGSIMALRDRGDRAELLWTNSIAGKPANMLTAADRLFIATVEGFIYCLGPEDRAVRMPSIQSAPRSPARLLPGNDSDRGILWKFPADEAEEPVAGLPVEPAWSPTGEWSTVAGEIVSVSGETNGYCLVLGTGSGALQESLCRLTKLSTIGLDTNAAAVVSSRERARRTGLASSRFSVVEGSILSGALPPYLANLIVVEDPGTAGLREGGAFVGKTFRSLRPYGGKICLAGDHTELFNRAIAAGGLAGARVSRAGGYTILERSGPLPGSSDWTHQYADAANTVVSSDDLVRLPLGLLWFGGSTNLKTLPRHGHGPSEQVSGGRLFLEGPNHMRAFDVYTGRVLWETMLPGIGARYDNTEHMPGANHTGSNFASATNGVYVCHRSACLRLDPGTGGTLSKFAMPGGVLCSQVRVWDDLLAVAGDPFVFAGSTGKPGQFNWDETCSRNLAVMDRYSGRVLWAKVAENAFHHNSIIAGDGMLFCIDRLPPEVTGAQSRSGLGPAAAGAPYRLVAMDMRSGRELWSTTRDVFGSWLGYSSESGVLLQSGRPSRDMVPGEPFGRLITYNARSGKVMWDRQLGIGDKGPYLLMGSMLIMQDGRTGRALDLLTGEAHSRQHPISGAPVEWTFKRTYGCNTAVGNRHLLTFRSGAAGFYDMDRLGGTGNFGGFKSGCTANLIPADGVLNAPDYTRTCTCLYQNQSSLALVHMPEQEMWFSDSAPESTGPVRQIGINFGAPGDRVAENGTLWLDYPSVGGTSPDPGVVVSGAVTYFRRHSLGAGGAGGMQWVTCSGVKGLASVKVPFGNAAARPYRVRLYFSEPEEVASGRRVFNVALQGRTVLRRFDIASEPQPREVVKEFPSVMIGAGLEIGFAAAKGAPVLCGVEAISREPPSVENEPASWVGAGSAVLNGAVLFTGATSSVVTVSWGRRDGGTDTTAWGGRVELGSAGVGKLSARISGLAAGTKYFYRFRAANDDGGSWAPSTASFITGRPEERQSK
ncbi:MAG: hypothetical protein C0404_05685 [Verrucomicrobia bacterium]|nr:hypothetical protein [Verrucomicrobiota bacterium]